MSEIKLKTHLIVTDVHEEYFIDWCGRIIDSNPVFENDKPVFIIAPPNTKVEMNTINMKRIEEVAKRLTHPRGREAITTDTAYIYIKEVNGGRKLIGKVVHNHVKEYRQMYDRFEYRDSN